VAPMSPSPSYANAYQSNGMDHSPSSVTDLTTSYYSSANRKPKKRCVTFKPTCTVRTYKYNIITEEEKEDLYYSKQELDIFNLEAHAIVTLSLELPDVRNTATHLAMERHEASSICSPKHRTEAAESSSARETLRGLELHMYPKRKQNKLLARKSLLKYQNLLNSKQPSLSPQRKQLALAAASSKLNLWSSLVALETARLDVLWAYEGGGLHGVGIPVVPPMTIIAPFPLYKKRRHQQQQRKHPRQERRVSRRITQAGDDGSQRAKRAKLLCLQRP